MDSMESMASMEIHGNPSLIYPMCHNLGWPSAQAKTLFFLWILNDFQVFLTKGGKRNTTPHLPVRPDFSYFRKEEQGKTRKHNTMQHLSVRGSTTPSVPPAPVAKRCSRRPPPSVERARANKRSMSHEQSSPIDNRPSRSAEISKQISK